MQMYEREKPDLLLLDVMMPRMDGWEVCRKVRAAGKTPVIMLTAKGGNLRQGAGAGTGRGRLYGKAV